ncbi:MAG: putative DNA binding domain-containing protein, partial [Lentisphaeria bacterium]|nr:putative DNA binding domain-containing protein [Lentisphaeria bacterium]
LPIGIDELLSGAVESLRLEFKTAWDPKRTGPQVIETITAFANDIQNINGGYVVIGIAEDAGVALRPVEGMDPDDIDAAQKWLRGRCRQIQPEYTPLLSPEQVDEKHVLVIWAPASEARPHQAPNARGDKERCFFVRDGSETVRAKGETRRRLIEQTARIPFDDRLNLEAKVEDLRDALVREFLRDVGSELVQERDTERIYELMRLTKPVNNHRAPRNIGLLLFSEDPEMWFPGARIELAEFRDEAGGNVIDEHMFRGPLHQQIKQCFAYLQGLTTKHTEKISDHSVTRGWVSYPSLALREAIVNAVYHRSYNGTPEPTKVYLYPNRIEVISYPGPVEGLELRHFEEGQHVPKVPARNRRIGEILKELRLAEARGTGVAKIRRTMRENGSPSPIFDFDATRTYFSVTLPAHPEYVALAALREYAYRSALGDPKGAIMGLMAAHRAMPDSGVIGARLIEVLGEQGDLASARALADSFGSGGAAERDRVQLAWARVLMENEKPKEAKTILDSLTLLDGSSSFEAAIMEKRLRRFKKAHRYFEKAGDRVLQDVKALHEFAQVKMKLADLPRGRRQISQRILREAEELLTRVVQMDAPPTRHAWAWYDLGRVRKWLKTPVSQQIEAFRKAVALAPDEHRFQEALSQAEYFAKRSS